MASDTPQKQAAGRANTPEDTEPPAAKTAARTTTSTQVAAAQAAPTKAAYRQVTQKA